uniref:Helicase ATP-binding domain-containing protein n=1 Tax=Fagus sylvatica TaxID=28930 RepID=A0A2N9HXV9_FAGSY
MDRIEATNELSFRVGFSGHSGHLRVEPISTVERSNPLNSLPDFVLPPAFARETPDSIKAYIEETYLSPRLDPQEFSPEKVGRQWDFDWFERAKVPLEPSLPRSIVIPTWELPFRRQKKGSMQEKWEPNSVQVDVSELMLGAQDSLPRATGPAKDFVRGSINNRPFRPGGLDDSRSLERIHPEGASNGEWVREVLNGGPAQAITPSLKKGLDLGNLKAYPSSWNVYKDQSLLKSTSDEKLGELSVQFDDLFQKAWEEDVVLESEGDDTKRNEAKSGLAVLDNWDFEELGFGEKCYSPSSDAESVELECESNKDDVSSSANEPELSLLDDILSVKSGGSTLKLDGMSGGGGKQLQQAWAVTGGSEGIAERFYELVPDMALEFPFELDKFQKEHCTRAVYTAPIKTISNQKYRDFCGKFDVGLLTGDVSLRPEASCLIMTTEILRSMLYRGADIIRDIEWVIFDEVHYVNDVERGVVWEEVIIMLPRHINFVLLSATVPNTVEFADWIGRTKQKEIRVTGAIGPMGDTTGAALSLRLNSPLPGFKTAKDAFKKKSLTGFGGGTGSYAGVSAARDGPQAQRPDTMYGTDLTSSSEKSEIRVFCDKAFSRLKGSDRNLPQIVRVQSLLHRGIGVHHAGLLPIVKEVVEMLFCRGVIKVLFSTETFAMGVNAPARTFFESQYTTGCHSDPSSSCVFDTLRKFDGKEFRQLLPGEYTQMAGRAGRRGLDKIGTVVVMCRDEILEESDLRHVMVGSATRLESQFRLTYIMILHLLRVEELKVEDMLKRSFAEFHAQKKLPEQQRSLMLKLAQPTQAIECIKGEPAIEEYYEMHSDADDIYKNKISDVIMQSPVAQNFLTPGRVAVVKSPSIDGSSAAYSQAVQQQLLDLKSDGKYPPALDPKDLKLKDVDLAEAYCKWTGLLEKMAKNKCHGCIKLEEHMKLAKEIKRHKKEVNDLKFEMSDEALQQMPDFQGRIDVLKEIGCIDADLVVQIKGRVACEMNSGEELICTECLFENQLDDLEPEEAVALMSAFVFQQKNTSEPSLTPNLSQAKKRALHFQDICELTDVSELRPDSAHHCKDWMRHVVRTIVRNGCRHYVVILQNLCCKWKLGNSAIYKKMEIASNAIKRDIVFAASLYVS